MKNLTPLKMTRYYDSLLIYLRGKRGYKLYALHRRIGNKLNGGIIWRYSIMPIPEQPLLGFNSIDEIYEHAYNTFNGQKELFDQWAKELQKDGCPTRIGKLQNALLYQWKVDNG